MTWQYVIIGSTQASSMQRALLFCLIFVMPGWAAEEFPEKELRAGYSRNLLARMTTELRERGMGLGEKFDAAQAIAQCDEVDKAMKEEVERKRALFYASKAAREKNDPQWNKQLFTEILFEDKPDNASLKEMLAQHIANQWPCISTGMGPCNDPVSLEMINIMADDPALLDEPVFGTCVRLIKLLRKAGTCTMTTEAQQTTCKGDTLIDRQGTIEANRDTTTIRDSGRPTIVVPTDPRNRWLLNGKPPALPRPPSDE